MKWSLIITLYKTVMLSSSSSSFGSSGSGVSLICTLLDSLNCRENYIIIVTKNECGFYVSVLQMTKISILLHTVKNSTEVILFVDFDGSNSDQ